MAKYRTEIRITDDGQSWFTDPTCRFGSPPSELMCDMIENLGEIIWRGANGEMVEAEQAGKFGVQAGIKLEPDSWYVMNPSATSGCAGTPQAMVDQTPKYDNSVMSRKLKVRRPRKRKKQKYF